MNVIDSVRDPPPRGEGTVKWLAGMIDPIGGYFLFALMWFGLSIAFLVIVPDLVVPKAVMSEHAGPIALAIFVALWIPFFVFVRQKRASTRRLFREGALVTATIAESVFFTKRGRLSTRLSLAFDSGGERRRSTVGLDGHRRDLPIGETMPLVYEASCRYVAVFTTPDTPVPATSSKG